MTEATGTTTTIYSGNYIYQNDELQMISQPEGYIEPNFTSSGVLTSSEVEMNYVYQYKDHLGNIRLTYKDDQLYDTDFNNGSYSPWTKSENTTSMTIEGKRLKVITGVHLNGANGYYNLLAGETYEIAVDIDRSLFTTDLEFSLWNGNSKIYGEYVTTSKTVKMNYTPTISATYRINLRLRDYGYAGGPQTFYLDNVIIRKTALAIIEENNYYPFGLKHQGYNDDYSPNRNAVATKFKYNSKELNDELGLDLYDYGARMYDPALGRWHVLDPLAEKYAEFSSYSYAANNPILIIDPDGKDLLIWYDNDKGERVSYRFTGKSDKNTPNNDFVTSVIEAWTYNVSNGGGDASFEAATNSKFTIDITQVDEYTTSNAESVYWNSSAGLETDNGTTMSHATLLDHELDHRVDALSHPNEHADAQKPNDTPYGSKEEERVISGSEQKTARANNEIKDGQVTRTNHYGHHVITYGVKSNKVNRSATYEFYKRIHKITPYNVDKFLKKYGK